MSRPRVLFYVQYLEGIGHVARAKRIVEELCQRGCAVTMVLGGHPIPGFAAGSARLCQLPPLGASPNSYSLLLQADGSPADDDFKAARREQLLAIFDEAEPNILITEAFPMGRWAMQFELTPLLARAHSQDERPMILASLRDILQMPKVAGKWQTSVALFERYYDHMLVHGDRSLARIEESFPPLAHLLDQAHYTGIVAPEGPPTVDTTSERFDVIVSAGGGAIADVVLAAAIAAKPASVMSDAQWLALAGPRMPQAAFDELQNAAKANGIRLERYRTGLTGLMAGAQLSIQRAGYNTVSDLLLAGCRGVLVPDAADRQMEQPLRAAKLAALDRAVVVDESGLTAATMAVGIDQAMALPPVDLKLNLQGAAISADIILKLFSGYQTAQNTAKPH